MYINTGTEITNTPTSIKASYNTWPYLPPKSEWMQHNPVYYIDQNGHVRKWDQWNPPKIVNVPGGMYKGTPTPTGSFYAQNTVIAPTNVITRENSCPHGQY